MNKIGGLTFLRPVNKNLHSEAHYWADLISRQFGENRLFKRYLGVIKRIGVDRAKAIFAEIKDGKAREPGKLFMWKSKSG